MCIRDIIYHDGIYAGNNTIIAAPHTGDVVRRETLWTGAYYVGRLVPPDVIGAGPESLSPDYVTGVGSRDDRIVPGVDAVVVDVPGGVVEEDHVTRLLLVLRNVPADGVLVDGVVRQPHPEVAEDDHDQAGAVEGVGTGAAPPVGGAVVRGSLGHDRIAETLGARR